MSRKITVTAKVNKEESDAIRDFCSQFDTSMGDLLRELIFYAIENAPITFKSPVLDLDGQKFPMKEDHRELRGVRPGTKKNMGR